MKGEAASPTTRRGPVRKLYDWMMGHASGRHAWWALFAVSFAESSFFPLPPDLMLIPMALADRRRAFLLAAWCTLASVLGGMLGYAIGALLYDTVGQWLVSLFGGGDSVEAFRELYAKYGAWTILIKGLTPIPYKIVTITAGFAGYNFLAFVALSAVTRFGRFALIAALIWFFGESIRHFIEKRLELVLTGVLIVIVAGFLIAKFLF